MSLVREAQVWFLVLFTTAVDVKVCFLILQFFLQILVLSLKVNLAKEGAHTLHTGME